MGRCGIHCWVVGFIEREWREGRFGAVSGKSCRFAGVPARIDAVPTTTDHTATSVLG